MFQSGHRQDDEPRKPSSHQIAVASLFGPVACGDAIKCQYNCTIPSLALWCGACRKSLAHAAPVWALLAEADFSRIFGAFSEKRVIHCTCTFQRSRDAARGGGR